VTYAEFISIFLILPTIMMAVFALFLKKTGCVRMIDIRYHWTGVAVLALIAFVWTTPWDNYLIFRGVWDSPPERIMGRLGYVPLEEYAFFILMTFFNGAFFLLLVAQKKELSAACDWPQQRLRFLALMIAAILACGGLLALAFTGGTYLGLILIWFTPPLLIQWLFAPRTLLRERKLVIFGTLIPSLYFGCADSFAIRNGIWEISSTLTTGVLLFNLPVEEFLFFVVTSLLLAQGLVLWHHLRSSSSLE